MLYLFNFINYICNIKYEIMKSLSHKILEQIPIEHIYRFLDQKNASKKQTGGERVGSNAASRKAKLDAIEAMAIQIAK